jgi:membrane protease YdiL (CAAX protease family)/LysM repeat protein
MTYALLYLLLITLAEILTAIIAPDLASLHLGVILHAVLLTALIIHGAATRHTPTRRLLLALTLAPLIRILSVSLPLQSLPLIDWYLIIGALLYVGTFFAIHMAGIGYKRMGFITSNLASQTPLALIGFGLGFIEYTILRPEPLIPELSWGHLLYAGLVLMIFTGFLEEIIFRGLVQEVASTIMGWWGILYGSLLFAVLHIGYLSWWDFFFVFAVGLLFAFIVHRTRSIIGVSLAHGFTNISLYLIFPFVFSGGLAFSLPEINFFKDEKIAPAGAIAPAPDVTHFPGRYSTSTPRPSPTSTAIPTETSLPATPSTLLPARPSPTACLPQTAGWVVYIIQPGDTLSSIAALHGLSTSSLKSANCLISTVIFSGQKIYVPALLPTITDTPTLEIIPTIEPPTETPSSPTPEPPTAEPPTPEPPSATPEIVEPSPTP